KPTYTVEELPEEVQVTEVVTKEGDKKRKVIKKRVIKKQKDGKQEKTEIVTIEEEGKKPETTVTVEELEEPEELAPEKPTYTVEELPEEVQVTEVVTKEGDKKRKVIKKRVIKKQKDGKQEKTEIVTVEEEGKKPETTVTVEELEEPEEVAPEKPTYTVEELPEEVQVTEVVTKEGDKKRKVIKKRVIKKQKDGKQEKTEIVTVEEEGKKPETTVTVEELEEPEEVAPEKPTYTVEELPEEVQVTEVVTKEGDKKRKVIKKRVIKKQKDGKQEKTEIVTVEEEGKKPETTVTVEELEEPEEVAPEKPTYTVEELPEEVQVTEVVTKEGDKKKKVIKKRVIKKQKDGKQEKTEIVTIEEEGKKPETTVTVEELSDIEVESTKPKVAGRKEVSVLMPLERKEIKPQKLKIVEGNKVALLSDVKLRKPKIVPKKEKTGKLPKFLLKSRITFMEFPPKSEQEKTPRISLLEPVYRETGIISRNAKEAEKIVKTKRRRLRDKDVNFSELEKLDLEMDELKGNKLETVDDAFKYEGKPKKKPSPEEKPKKLSIKKGKMPIEEETDEQIKLKPIPKKVDKVLLDETDEQTLPKPSIPESTDDQNENDKLKFKPFEYEREDSEESETEIVPTNEESDVHPREERVKRPKKKKTKSTPETESVTLIKGIPKPKPEGEDDEISLKYKQKPKPEDAPEEISLKPFKKDKKSKEFKPEIEDIFTPSQLVTEEILDDEVVETVTPEGKQKKVIIKKRIIKKPKGKVQEKTEICTVEEEDKEPQTTVTVEEIQTPEEIEPDKPVYIVEELPEEIQVTEVVNKEGDKKRKVIKKRVIKKHKDGKEEKTEIVTIEEEGKKPKTTVTIEETPKEKILFVPTLHEAKSDFTDEEILNILKIELIKKHLAHPLPQLPLQLNVSLGTCAVVYEYPEEIVTRVLPTGEKEVIRKRPLKKIKGRKQEVIEISTHNIDEEKPETAVEIREGPKTEELHHPVAALIELPEDVSVIEITTKGKKPSKKITKKRTLLKKSGPAIEATEIVTILEDGKEPQQSVYVHEYTDVSTLEPELVVQEYLTPKITPFTSKTITEVYTSENTQEVGLEEPTDLTTEKAKVIQDIQEPVVIETVQTQKPIPKIPESQKPEDATEQTIEADEVVETIEEEAPKRRVVKKKIVKKPKGDTHGTTEILFVEEEEIESQQSVVLPEEIEELPEEIKVIESVEDGVTKKTVVKKRVIKKDKKGKKETTEILTVEEEGKEPQTSITVYEEEKPKEEITSLEELPEEIKVIESVEDGVTKKTVVKKRVIKKDKKGKKETTEILTV
ncbi:unnamed protein product, partial [Diabrotica balteata]